MTPKRRAEFERLMDALEAESHLRRAFPYGSRMEYAAARAALAAFVEQEEGELHTVEFLAWKAPDGETVRLYHVFTPNHLPGDRVRVVNEAK